MIKLIMIENTNIRGSDFFKESKLTLIFGVFTFCQHLWHGVKTFPENFNTFILCLLQLKAKGFLCCAIDFPTFLKICSMRWTLRLGATPALYWLC